MANKIKIKVDQHGLRAITQLIETAQDGIGDTPAGTHPAIQFNRMLHKFLLADILNKVAVKSVLINQKSYSINLSFAEASAFWININPLCSNLLDNYRPQMQEICDAIHKKITSL